MLWRYALVVVFVVSSLAGTGLEAKEPAYRNPGPSLRPISRAKARAIGPKKRGAKPTIDAKRYKKLLKGHIERHKIVLKDPKKARYQAWKAIGIIDASPKAVMGFLSDYPGKVGYMPFLTSCSVTWKQNLAEADFVLNVPGNIMRYRLRLAHYGDAFLEFEYLHGSLKDSYGSYRMFPIEGGKKTLMVYETISMSGVPLPRPLLSLLSRRSLPGVIKGIRKAIKDKPGAYGP